MEQLFKDQILTAVNTMVLDASAAPLDIMSTKRPTDVCQSTLSARTPTLQASVLNVTRATKLSSGNVSFLNQMMSIARPHQVLNVVNAIKAISIVRPIGFAKELTPFVNLLTRLMDSVPLVTQAMP